MITGCDREWKKPESFKDFIANLHEGCRFLYDSSTRTASSKKWRIFRRGVYLKDDKVMFAEWVAIVKEDDKRPPMFESNEQEILSFPEAEKRLSFTWGLYYYDESC